jgi:hypothetical protein
MRADIALRMPITAALRASDRRNIPEAKMNTIRALNVRTKVEEKPGRRPVFNPEPVAGKPGGHVAPPIPDGKPSSGDSASVSGTAPGKTT